MPTDNHVFIQPVDLLWNVPSFFSVGCFSCCGQRERLGCQIIVLEKQVLLNLINKRLDISYGFA
jgi:hypothetical protein